LNKKEERGGRVIKMEKAEDFEYYREMLKIIQNIIL
jgi:hypothetical protein